MDYIYYLASLLTDGNVGVLVFHVLFDFFHLFENILINKINILHIITSCEFTGYKLRKPILSLNSKLVNL